MDSLSSLVKAVFPCLPIGPTERSIQLPTETTKHQSLSEKFPVQPSPYGDHAGKKPNRSPDVFAAGIVMAMLDADEAGPSLDATIESIVHTAGGWTEYLAAKVLALLEAALKTGKPLSAAMQESYDKVYEAFKATEGFAVEHPIATEVFVTVIALGLLVEFAPVVLEYLGFCAGFGELGPIEGELCLSLSGGPHCGKLRNGILMLILVTGSWAALWQSRYAGMVPKGSLFSFFQRLGMKWKHV